MRRLQLNLWRPAGHRDEPKTVIVHARMTDLQLANLNSVHLCRQSFDDLVNVSAHTSMPNVPAQVRRAKDVRLPTETRSRRCLQPDGWAVRSSSIPWERLRWNIVDGGDDSSGHVVPADIAPERRTTRKPHRKQLRVAVELQVLRGTRECVPGILLCLPALRIAELVANPKCATAQQGSDYSCTWCSGLHNRDSALLADDPAQR